MNLRTKIPLAGIFVLLFSAIALLFPLLWLNTDHPLAQVEEPALCPYIAPLLGDLFPDKNLKLKTRLPDFRRSPANCGLYQPGGELLLWASIMTRKSLFHNDMRHADTQNYWQQWVSESRADNKTLKQIKHEWNRAIIINNSPDKDTDELLIEDYGVLIRIGSSKLDHQQMLRFAVALSAALRQKK